jgi:hypothetical protein
MQQRRNHAKRHQGRKIKVGKFGAWADSTLQTAKAEQGPDRDLLAIMA